MGCANSKESRQVIDNTEKPTAGMIKVSPRAFLIRSKGTLSTNYTELKTIGSGAYAEVKLCEYRPLRQHRAVKIVHKAGLRFQQMDSDYMLKEISILIALDHPNILRCYEIFEDHWKFYIATEYCEGGELLTMISQLQRFSEKEAAEIFFQIISSVAYCHSKGVIHRDLKPQNILLMHKHGSLSIKVADFGSSCFLDPHRKLSGCFGSSYYCAPEVFRGAYSEKCDIWSCGVILFILLSGSPPYNGKDNKEILKKIETAPLLFTAAEFPNLSTEALDLASQLLEINPASRITALQALSHPWVHSFQQGRESLDLTDSLTNLASFSSSAKLKDAVHVYLASHVISSQEIDKLQEEFQQIDKNGDGKISKTELIEQYIKLMDEEKAKTAVDAIMKEVDADESGEIDYIEFLTACMDYKKYISKEFLQESFKVFDKDGSGQITIDEIQSILGEGKNINLSAFKDVIGQVDLNDDGAIDIKEFINLMTR